MTLPADLKDAVARGLKLSQFVILKLLRESGPKDVASLVALSGVSDATIRRELRALANKKLVRPSKVPPRGGPADRAAIYSIRKEA